jgi:hypothetical protein
MPAIGLPRRLCRAGDGGGAEIRQRIADPGDFHDCLRSRSLAEMRANHAPPRVYGASPIDLPPVFWIAGSWKIPVLTQPRSTRDKDEAVEVHGGAGLAFVLRKKHGWLMPSEMKRLIIDGSVVDLRRDLRTDAR